MIQRKTTKTGTNLTCFSWFDPQNKSAFSANLEESGDKNKNENERES